MTYCLDVDVLMLSESQVVISVKCFVSWCGEGVGLRVKKCPLVG